MFDYFAKQGEDLASEEKGIDLEFGEEQDEKLAGPVIRSSGEPNLPRMMDGKEIKVMTSRNRRSSTRRRTNRRRCPRTTMTKRRRRKPPRCIPPSRTTRLRNLSRRSSGVQ
jgi:hypothetical protein